MRDEIQKTDEEIEALFVETFGACLCVSNLTFTRDTIEDILAARKTWAEPGKLQTNEGGVLEIAAAQSEKGQPRKDVCVIDFGTVRAVART